jgi:prephenate dehydrogenase
VSDAADSAPLADDCVAVIGLGLIGGSLARDLHALGARVLAFDIANEHMQRALAAGAVDAALDESLAGLRDADVVILAVPVDAARGVLASIARQARHARLVTDTGSTKAAIVAAAHALELGARFVGSHPMAGDHRAGWAASREHLFRDATVYLCATPDTGAAVLDAAAALWRALGAHPSRIDATEHDAMLAWASHLPHVVSAALAVALARADVSRDQLGPGGRDVTRLAGGSPDLWTGIARENAAALASAIDAARASLDAFAAALRGGDDALRLHLAEAHEWFVRGDRAFAPARELKRAEPSARVG